jgi:hypothetical protein
MYTSIFDKIGLKLSNEYIWLQVKVDKSKLQNEQKGTRCDQVSAEKGTRSTEIHVQDTY